MLSYLGYNRVAGLLGAEGLSSTLGLREREPSATVEPAPAPAPVPESPAYDPPSTVHYFAHFVDHPALFIHFLESVATERWHQEVSMPPPHTTPLPVRDIDTAPLVDPAQQEQRSVWNTLLELYLSLTSSADEEIAQAAKSKALGILARSDLPYDPMHALILCTTASFTAGLVRLWESMGMYEDVLRYWMEQDRNGDSPSASQEVLHHLDMYGPTNPHLYPLVLRYLTSLPAILSRHPQNLTAILEKIDEERIMPPLAVVQLLSRNGVASVGSVKDWLRSKVADTKDEIAAVSDVI
jgi:hypothetical protein